MTCIERTYVERVTVKEIYGYASSITNSLMNEVIETVTYIEQNGILWFTIKSKYAIIAAVKNQSTNGALDWFENFPG